jgi:hypothetical protein
MAAQRVKKDTDLGKICTEGEPVQVSFGTKKEKTHYKGTYTDGKIAYVSGGQIVATTPSGFAEVMGVAHFGHNQSYNGWVKCTVLRAGVWVTLDSLRSAPAPAAAEPAPAAAEPAAEDTVADMMRLAQTAATALKISAPALRFEFIAGFLKLCSDPRFNA